MYRTLALAVVLTFAVASGAMAKPCKDAGGKFVKCPPAAAIAADTTAKAAPCKDAKGKFIKCSSAALAPAKVEATGNGISYSKSTAPVEARDNGMPSVTGAPVCKVGKPCGKSCISKSKVCHKPS